ncbi:MAG: HisA/HisF-related TIM barrel protein [Pirellulales bacterium]
MRVIPVIDLKAGQVVHGIAGRRDEYQPIRSSLVDGADPPRIAQAMIERLGCGTLYVADLDAITGAPPALSVYEQLASQGARLWIDAGIDSTARCQDLLAWDQRNGALEGLIVGLESLPSFDELERWLALAGPARLIFSVDLKAGAPITHDRQLAERGAEGIALAAVALGVRRLIVLDLARVGTGSGAGTEQLCRSLRAARSDLELTAGGGVRGVGDLRALAAAGCHAVLVASALHDGRITRADLASLRSPDTADAPGRSTPG